MANAVFDSPIIACYNRFCLESLVFQASCSDSEGRGFESRRVHHVGAKSALLTAGESLSGPPAFRTAPLLLLSAKNLRLFHGWGRGMTSNADYTLFAAAFFKSPLSHVPSLLLSAKNLRLFHGWGRGFALLKLFVRPYLKPGNPFQGPRLFVRFLGFFPYRHTALCALQSLNPESRSWRCSGSDRLHRR